MKLNTSSLSLQGASEQLTRSCCDRGPSNSKFESAGTVAFVRSSMLSAYFAANTCGGMHKTQHTCRQYPGSGAGRTVIVKSVELPMAIAAAQLYQQWHLQAPQQEWVPEIATSLWWKG